MYRRSVWQGVRDSPSRIRGEIGRIGKHGRTGRGLNHHLGRHGREIRPWIQHHVRRFERGRNPLRDGLINTDFDSKSTYLTLVNLPSPISYLLSPISYLLSPNSHLPSPISYLLSPISYLPSPISHLPSPISHLPSPTASPQLLLRSLFNVRHSTLQELGVRMMCAATA